MDKNLNRKLKSPLPGVKQFRTRAAALSAMRRRGGTAFPVTLLPETLSAEQAPSWSTGLVAAEDKAKSVLLPLQRDCGGRVVGKGRC